MTSFYCAAYLGIPTPKYIFQNLKKLTENIDSIPCSQDSATGIYPEPDESSPHHYVLFL
jgi:hypothetical protein